MNPWLAFLGFTLSVSALASFLARSPHAYPVQAAVCMDLALTVPGAWYFLMVRPGLRPMTTVPFVALLGLWRASLLFPNIVPGKIWIGAAVELAIVSGIVFALHRASRASAAFEEADPVDRLRSAFSSLLSGTATPRTVSLPVKAMATEFSIFYYAFGWALKPHVPRNARAFFLHERSGTQILMGCLSVISLLEIAPVHLLLRHSFPNHHGVAWTASALSLWGAVWMLAFCRSFALRPTLVSADGIVVRFGLLFRLTLPASRIAAIEFGAPPEGIRVIPKATPATFHIRFTEPLLAELPGGLTRRIDALGLSSDDDAAFRAAIAPFAAQISTDWSGRD